ncbi:hypothetical protein [Candidatus Poriferisodalis sp.]|uniref:hypothetical protein n=1 Tax=Candidatus Poriferisodalis sp. TaxID=3101277 RepID=UPI003B5A34A9
MADARSREVSASESPAFESPVVRSYPAAEAGDLTLSDVSATTKWLVRAGAQGPAADLLGARFGSSQIAPSGALVLGSRPGEWIVLGTSSEVAAAVAELDGLDSQEFVSALDWTHSRAMFRVTGRESARMLEKVCSLDWADPMTPDGAVSSASVAKVTCDIARNDIDGAPSYLIFCDRSFGQYLFDALIDAGNEFGLSVAAAGA